MAEFVASGSLKNEKPNEYRQIVDGLKKKVFQEAIEARKKLSYLSKNTRENQELVQIVADHLSNGRDLLPIYFLETSDFIEQVKHDWAGAYMPKADAIVVNVTGSETPIQRLRLLATIAHEVIHAAGRNVFAVKTSKDKEDFLIVAQRGCVTRCAKKSEESIRGLGLDEGIAEYFCRKLTLINDPRINKLRREAIDESEVTGDIWSASSGGDYFLVETMIAKLVEKGGSEMELLLLDALMKKGGKGILYRKLFDIYGRECAKEIMSVPLETKRLRVLLEKM